jgi:hypothetical protein
MMAPCSHKYLVALALWSTLNFAYLTWFFGRQQSLQETRRRLAQDQE